MQQEDVTPEHHAADAEPAVPPPNPLAAWFRVMFTPPSFFARLRGATIGHSLLFAALVGGCVNASHWRPMAAALDEFGAARLAAGVASFVVVFVAAVLVWGVVLHGVARFSEGEGTWRHSIAVAAYSTAPWAVIGVAGVLSAAAAASPWRPAAGYYTLLLAAIGLVRLHRAYRGTVVAVIAAMSLLWTLVMLFSFRSAAGI